MNDNRALETARKLRPEIPFIIDVQTLSQPVSNILVSEIGMPDIDGYIFVRQVQALETELRARVPAVALTAYAREIALQQAFAAGFEQHIYKPVEPEELVKAIACAIALVRKHRRY